MIKNTELKLEKIIHLDIENKLYNNNELDLNLDIKTDNMLDLDLIKVISIEDSLDIERENIDSDTLSSLNDSTEDIDTNILPFKTNTPTNKLSGLTKMRVGDLRSLAIENGLLENIEIANKLKKDNLIKLLQA